jgi:hypothetical protein
MSEYKQYLGDSVYADVIDGGIVLTTENGYPDDPRNSIYLEAEVLRMLDEYRAWLSSKANEAKAREENG